MVLSKIIIYLLQDGRTCRIGIWDRSFVITGLPLGNLKYHGNLNYYP